MWDSVVVEREAPLRVGHLCTRAYTQHRSSQVSEKPQPLVQENMDIFRRYHATLGR